MNRSLTQNEKISFAEALVMVDHHHRLNITIGFNLKDNGIKSKIDFLELPGTGIPNVSSRVAMLLCNVEGKFPSPKAPGIALRTHKGVIGYFNVIPNLNHFPPRMKKELREKCEKQYDAIIGYDVASVAYNQSMKWININYALCSPMQHWMKFVAGVYFPEEYKKGGWK